MKKYSVPVLVLSFLLLTAFCLTMTGCGASSYEYAPSKSYSSAAQYKSAYDGDMAYTEEYIYDDEYYPSENMAEMEEGFFEDEVLSSQVERKLTYVANVTLETKSYRDTIAQIEALVSDFNGFVASSEISDYGEDTSRIYARYASYTVKVPAGMLDGYIEALKSAGNVSKVSKQVDDITSAYYDTQARLESLKAEEKKLIEMQESADNLEDMITIESYLSDIRYEMNYLSSMMAVYEEQVSYSTVYINVSEVLEYSEPEVEDSTFGERIADTFSESGEVFLDFLQELLLVLIAILPFLILIGLIVLVIVLLAKSGKKRRLAKRQKAFQEAQARMAVPVSQAVPVSSVPMNPSPVPESSEEKHQ